jgi:16S rRNA U516 pseudouridylate synthase RsuA-like enzyme
MVTSLKRLRIGNVLLKDLPSGKTREITKQELFI